MYRSLRTTTGDPTPLGAGAALSTESLRLCGEMGLVLEVRKTYADAANRAAAGRDAEVLARLEASYLGRVFNNESDEGVRKGHASTCLICIGGVSGEFAGAVVMAH